MYEYPILFNSEMVRAILVGKKTQMRRPMKKAPSNDFYFDKMVESYPCDKPEKITYAAHFWNKNNSTIGEMHKAIYNIGDVLWVRETWGMAFAEHLFPSRPKTVGGTWGIPAYPDLTPCVIYRADGKMPKSPKNLETARWSPSIHMPRWASRINLLIKNIYIEQIRDISEENARKEGIIDGGCLNCGEKEPCKCDNPSPSPRDSFISIWDSSYAKKGFSWNINPFVWVIEFERIK